MAVVLAVDREGRDLGELPSRGHICPVSHHGVAVIARAENGAHVGFSPLVDRFRDGPKDETSDVQLHIGESRDSGFASAMRPGMTVDGFTRPPLPGSLRA